MKRGDATITRVANAIYYTCCLVALCWFVVGGLLVGGLLVGGLIKDKGPGPLAAFAVVFLGPALLLWFVGRLCSWVLAPPVRSRPSQQRPFGASSQQPRTEEPLILCPESARRLILVAIGWFLLAEAVPLAVGFFQAFATGFVRGLTKGAFQLEIPPTLTHLLTTVGALGIGIVVPSAS